MPRSKKYENRIPAFYRKSTLDVMLFAHVTALREYIGINDNNRCEMSIERAIENFFELYHISTDDFPVESATTIYNRMWNAFMLESIKIHFAFEKNKK